MDKPHCALTMGDPSGIGPEIILKTLFSQRANDAAGMVVIGYPEPFVRDAKFLDLDISIKKIRSPRQFKEKENTLHLIEPSKSLKIPADYGIINTTCGLAAAVAIELSAKMALNGDIDAVITAPINKESLNMAGFCYPGHTEFYQYLPSADDTAMMLSLGNFRIIHVVTHSAIRDVPGMITEDRIVRVASLMHDTLLLLGIKRPKLAVCGLNPHAGESGLFGREEIEVINPAVETLQADGINVTGSLPPDTVFARAYSGEFDGVVAMFHDQGHIALKLAGFKLAEGARKVGGVNVTLGLPFIRTSVDHGTAFDIAGKGQASPLSMIEAVELASQLVRGKKLQKRL